MGSLRTPPAGPAPCPAPAAPAPRNPGLDHPDLQRMRAQDAAHDRTLDRFGPRERRRWKFYVLGSVVGFPLATWFFTPAGFEALWLQIPIAAVYGTFVCFARPTGTPAALGTVAAGLAVQAATGHVALGFALVVSMFFYGAIGLVVGIGEHGKLMDGR